MKWRIAIYLAAFFITIIGFGSISRAETYTLDQCIDMAMRNNYDVLVTKYIFDDAKFNVYAAWGRLLPSITLSASGGRSWSGFAYRDPITGELISGGVTSHGYSGVISFRNSFPGMGLYNYASIKKSGSDKQSSFFDYQTSRKNVVLVIKVIYYDMVRAKMLFDVASDAVKRGEERLRAAQNRYELGSASLSDVLKAKVQFGNDKLDLVGKTNDHKIAKANLAYSMGINVNMDFDVDENYVEREIDISFNDAMKEALSSNPVYQKARFDLFSAKSYKTMIFTRFLPSLSVGMSHSTSVGDFTDLLDFERNGAGYNIFASLDFNIFNGFSDYADLKAAKNTVKIYQANLETTENDVALQLKQSFLDLEKAREAKDLAEESVTAAQEDLNLVKEKYNLGAATILEVLDAEVSFKEAQTNKVQAIFDYNLAVARLEKALGR